MSHLPRRLLPRFALALLFATILLFPHQPFAQAPQKAQYDILIINAHILDGTGSPWYEGSVAIKDGKIAEIGRIANVSANRTIDAKGLIVAPGFVDLHSHSDFALLADGKAESKIRQGVTTEIIGESASAGPVLGSAIPPLDKELAAMRLTRTWTTLGEYFATLQKHGTAVNIASYVGSGQVRLDVMGGVMSFRQSDASLRIYKVFQGASLPNVEQLEIANGVLLLNGALRIPIAALTKECSPIGGSRLN